MKFAYIVTIALIAFSVVDAASNGLEDKPQSIDFSDENRVASVNTLKAGEQILEAVNDAFQDDDKVDGDRLLDVAKRLVNKDPSLNSPDKKTQDVIAALHKAVEKLFPGEDFDTVLHREVGIVTRHLAELEAYYGFRARSQDDF